MNILASECSSGCESGWTLYLDQSYSTTNASHSYRADMKFVSDKYKGKKYEEQEEEDLSMVSDASSGPPHFHEEEENYGNSNDVFFSVPTILPTSSVKTKKNRGNRHLLDQQLAFLDDTASSPAFNNSSQKIYTITNRRTSVESVLEFTQDVSTPFQSGSALQGHHGYMQSSHSQNQYKNNQLWWK